MFSVDDIEDDEERDITFRSPNPAATPNSAAPLLAASGKQRDSKQGRRSHRHTASIASLIRPEDRNDDGWGSGNVGKGAKEFKFPPTPLRTDV